MENKIYNDDVERIVNDPERQEAIEKFHNKRQKKRQKKILSDSVIAASITVFFGAMSCAGLITTWISVPICCASGLVAAFFFGRWIENGKCKGWF